MTMRFVFVFCFFICLSPCISAQGNIADSTLHNQAVASLRAQYMKSMGVNSFLYNGEAYDHYWNASAGHPFFLYDQFETGTIDYDGTFYDHIPLLYDINRDQLVSKSFKDNEMSFIGEKIRAFTIGTHRFTRIPASNSNGEPLSPGFYELLYDGSVQVLVKHDKKLERSVKIGDNLSYFNQYEQYYIEKDGRYFSAGSEKEIQNIFPDQKAEIRKFLNRRDIRFKKDKPKTLVLLAAYYEQLKK